MKTSSRISLSIYRTTGASAGDLSDLILLMPVTELSAITTSNVSEYVSKRILASIPLVEHVTRHQKRSSRKGLFLK